MFNSNFNKTATSHTTVNLKKEDLLHLGLNITLETVNNFVRG